MSETLERAQRWMADVHPHNGHLERTLDWLVVLDPGASEAARIAAATHDVERAYPDGDTPWDSARDWDSAEYNRWHQDRCAEIASGWLREQGAAEPLVAEVDKLIRVHEEGGWREADLLQAADSLSFLETLTWLMKRWPRANAEAKLDASVERIKPSLPRARELAEPLREAARSALVAA
jgi:hypothetical protein